MRGLSGLPVDDDVIDRILVCSPDFPTLLNAILASKSFHSVFNVHPISTIRAVAYNVAGPALPQLMTVIRLEEPFSEDDDPPEEIETDDIGRITQEELKDLQRLARVASQLEDIFSLRHKDRTSEHSRLSSLESWRFRRAIYRLMLYSKVFPSPGLLPNVTNGLMFGVSFTPDQVTKDIRKRQGYLTGLPPHELFELHTVVEFHLETARWALRALGVPTLSDLDAQVSLVHGPEDLVKTCHQRTGFPVSSSYDPQLLTDYISGPLNFVWDARKTQPAQGEAHWRSIVDEAYGDQDTCTQCSHIGGIKLWGRTNWQYLRGIWEPFSNNVSSGIFSLLRGQLRQTGTASELYIELTRPEEPYKRMMEGIFDVKQSPTFDNWSEDDWLCDSCISDLISENLHLWLRELEREAGKPDREDCWYGYNCRTQTHRQAHADRLNHLCEPVRGD